MVHVFQEKVAAYITWRDHVLVFRQPQAPQAGIQTPGGTMEEGEAPREAVLREAQEETGLSDLELVSYLGRRDAGYKNELGHKIWERRHFFHLRLRSRPPERWQHWEMTPSGGLEGPILFELWWAPLSEAEALVDEWFAAYLALVTE